MKRGHMLAKELPCIVLGIDPGTPSGWALAGAVGSDVGIVEPKDWQSREFVVQHALAVAERREVPLVVIGEEWRVSGSQKSKEGKDKRWNTPTIAGLGARWGHWEDELWRGGVPDKRILRVDTGTWRMVMFGRGRMTEEQSKQHAMMRAKAHGVRGLEDLGKHAHNAAEAFCIAVFGLRWSGTKAVLNKSHLAGWSET